MACCLSASRRFCAFRKSACTRASCSKRVLRSLWSLRRSDSRMSFGFASSEKAGPSSPSSPSSREVSLSLIRTSRMSNGICNSHGSAKCAPLSGIPAQFVADLIKETLGLRQDRGILGCRKVAEDLLLLLAELAGNLNENLHQLIAGALAAQIGQSLAAQLEDFSMLRAGWEVHLLFSVQC